MPSVTMNVLHLVVLVNVAHALRDQKVKPLIYDEFDNEIAKDDNVHTSQKTASHLEIRETAAADVDRLNHLEHLDLFVPKLEVVTKELAEAKELQLDHLDCTGTLPLSGYFKVSTKLTISEPCNITADRRGLMVDAPDITRSLHCPNPLACPGGLLSANESKPMCSPGYEGPGCSKCAVDFARTDSNVFICMKCATDTLSKVKELLVFVGNDALIFAISAAGVISAQGRNKNSAVFLNQLMAFAAVIAPALLALKQTKTLKDQLKWLQQLLLAASIPIQVGDGESSTGVSTECLLTYFGLEASLVSAQVLSLVVYTMLGLVLAFKSGWRVAVVVAVNCFMPKFCAAFGKYLICYRMEPASKQDEMYCLLGDYSVPGMVIAMAAILLCFLVGPGSWLRMVRDKNRTEEAQVLYLTRSYQSGYETWEVERLLRKMMLKLISATLPVTLNPSMQMACLSLVLTASVLLHATNAPYVKVEWNHVELGLLATALVTIILTSLCLANEIHWAHSDAVQITLIVLVAGLVTIAGGLQSVLLVRELIRERQPPEPEPVENEDTASKS